MDELVFKEVKDGVRVYGEARFFGFYINPMSYLGVIKYNCKGFYSNEKEYYFYPRDGVISIDIKSLKEIYSYVDSKME